jgi:catechol 2,3-dioxygenase-like lactoylglutathione lyase family enzyme
LLTGLNHLTLAVTDLDRSVDFYTALLGLRLEARWDGGAYLSLGGLWLCLSLDPARAIATPGADYTHYAFSIAQPDFDAFCARLRAAGVREWRKNRSEGDSFYFLDPDDHQLELHVGDLASRLAACRAAPYAGMRFATGPAD